MSVDDTKPRCECPDTAAIARHFDYRAAERAQTGNATPAATTQRLLQHLLPADPRGKTVLELGCGPGGLLLRLAEAGAARVTGIDLSPAAIDEARGRLESAGLGDRASFSLGDAAHEPLEPHDWVILDRVMCCYPDVHRLLANSVASARALYAFTAPTSRGWRGMVARVDRWVSDIQDRRTGTPCRSYVHDLDAVEDRLRAAGFRETDRDRAGLTWHIAVFQAA